MDSWEAQISAVAALDKPTRRRLYNYVQRQLGPVNRDATAALGLLRSTARFHLDRLVGQRLLDSDYQRLTGRIGPRADPPAKLYRRSFRRQVTVSLPPRCYELAGRLLSNALQRVERFGESPPAILNQHAYERGKALGEMAHSATGSSNALTTALRILEDNGFQPRVEDNDVILDSCLFHTFHTLAQEYNELICGMELRLLNDVHDGLAPTKLTAQLRPTPTRCCVRLAGAAHR